MFRESLPSGFELPCLRPSIHSEIIDYVTNSGRSSEDAIQNIFGDMNDNQERKRVNNYEVGDSKILNDSENKTSRTPVWVSVTRLNDKHGVDMLGNSLPSSILGLLTDIIPVSIAHPSFKIDYHHSTIGSSSSFSSSFNSMSGTGTGSS